MTTSLSESLAAQLSLVEDVTVTCAKCGALATWKAFPGCSASIPRRCEPCADAESLAMQHAEERRVVRERRAAFEASLSAEGRMCRPDAKALADYVRGVGDPGAVARRLAAEHGGRRGAPGRSLVFSGPPRVGKTALATATLWAAFELSPAARLPVFGHACDLAEVVSRHRLGDGEPPDLVAACTAPILLLDDLGSERDTANSALPTILQRRFASLLPTWVTTGLAQEEVKARYGEGFAGRVYERAKRIALRGVVPNNTQGEQQWGDR